MKRLALIVAAVLMMNAGMAYSATTTTDYVKNLQAKRDAAIQKQDAKVAELQKKQAEQKAAVDKKKEEIQKKQADQKAAVQAKQAEQQKKQQARKDAWNNLKNTLQN